MNNISVKRKQVTAPADIVDIFYDEALRISGNGADAVKLTNDATEDFISHYRRVVSRTRHGG